MHLEDTTYIIQNLSKLLTVNVVSIIRGHIGFLSILEIHSTPKHHISMTLNKHYLQLKLLLHCSLQLFRIRNKQNYCKPPVFVCQTH